MIGAGAVIAEGAHISGSAILSNAVIGPGAIITDSLVGAGARVGARTTLTNTVIGDGATVGPDNELRAGARVWCDTTLPPASIRFSSDE